MQLSSGCCPMRSSSTQHLETGSTSTSKPAALPTVPVRRSPMSQRSKLRQNTQTTQAYDQNLAGSVSSLVSSGLVAAIGWQLLKQPEVSGSSREQGDQVRVCVVMGGGCVRRVCVPCQVLSGSSASSVHCSVCTHRHWCRAAGGLTCTPCKGWAEGWQVTPLGPFRKICVRQRNVHAPSYVHAPSSIYMHANGLPARSGWAYYPT